MQGGCLFGFFSRKKAAFLAPQREKEGGQSCQTPSDPVCHDVQTPWQWGKLPCSHEGPTVNQQQVRGRIMSQKTGSQHVWSVSLIHKILTAPKAPDWATSLRLFSSVWANNIHLHLINCTDKESNPPPDDWSCPSHYCWLPINLFITKKNKQTPLQTSSNVQNLEVIQFTFIEKRER